MTKNNEKHYVSSYVMPMKVSLIVSVSIFIAQKTIWYCHGLDKNKACLLPAFHETFCIKLVFTKGRVSYFM